MSKYKIYGTKPTERYNSIKASAVADGAYCGGFHLIFIGAFCLFFGTAAKPAKTDNSGALRNKLL